MSTQVAKVPAKSKNFGLSIIKGDQESPIDMLLAITTVRKKSINETVDCEKNIMGTPVVGVIKAIIEECKNANELAYAFYYYGQLSAPRLDADVDL